MTIHKLGYIQFKTHSVSVCKDDDLRIYCFKSTKTRCDYQSFDSQELAADYILAPFPSVVYELVFPEDSNP